MFLPDRYIKGTAPIAARPTDTATAENCGATFAPTDLKEPKSVLSSHARAARSEHHFFKVGRFEDFLRGWPATSPCRGQGQADGMAGQRRRAARTGHLAQRHASASIPTRPASISRLAGCADRLPEQLPQPVRDQRRGFDAYLKPDSQAERCHFVGDIVNFRPVLAGGAARQRPPGCTSTAT